MAVSTGTRIGRYEVIELVGSGGMGEVYRARDDRLQRDVALKILPDQGDTSEATRRFETEARAIAALSHPNIVNIYDYGAEGGKAYIAMELLEGETLRSVMSRSALTPRRAVKIAAGVAEALRCSHAKGIAHRDLKPENIFITRDGTAKVLDFGLARIMAPEVARDSQAITREGTIMGTIDYMSPEQVRGEESGPSSDIFSLGCILFEMLGRVKPFARTSTAETTAAILRDDPPDLQALRPDVSQPIVRIVTRCLEKEPAQRFQSAADLAFALEAVSDSSPTPKPEVQRPARPRQQIAWGVPIVLLAAIAALVLIARRQPPSVVPTSPKHAVNSVAVLPFTNTEGSLEYLSDGLTEAIINNLLQIASPVTGFKVMSRNLVFQYKGKNPDPRDVGNELNVDTIVTGRVAQRRGGLQIGWELVDARDGHQIGGESFEWPLSDIGGLESELSRRISEKLQMRLSGADQSRIENRAAVKPAAYDLYLQGRYEWNKRTVDGLHKGIKFFQQSIDLDPTYARAHAGIADSYLLLGGNYEVLPPLEAMPIAEQSARKALAIDENLAEAHASLGVIEHEFAWDWPKAEAQFKRAIALNPNYVVAHQWYGHALIYRSRFDEGLHQLKKAEELDPLSFVTKADIAQAFWIARRYDESIAAAQRTIEIEPDFWLSYLYLGFAYAGKEDFPHAAEALEKAVDLGGTPMTIGALGYVYARQGRSADARRLIQRLDSMRTERYISPASYVLIYAGLGDLDSAYAGLERAFHDRSSLLTMLNVVPIADSIRRDARYAPLAGRIKLPPLP